MTPAASMAPAGHRDLKTVRPVSPPYLLNVSYEHNTLYPVSLQTDAAGSLKIRGSLLITSD